MEDRFYDTPSRQIREMLEQVQEDDCAEAFKHASVQADTLLRNAHSQARARMHQAITDERRLAQQRISATQARIDMQYREWQQQTDQQALQQAWALLRQGLEHSWLEETIRIQWIDNIAQRAIEQLPSGAWIVEHPQQWAAHEQERFCRRIAESTGYTPELAANSCFSGGLRICSEGTCIDSSIEGLLSRRRMVESHLLNQIHHLQSETTSQGTDAPTDE